MQRAIETQCDGWITGNAGYSLSNCLLLCMDGEKIPKETAPMFCACLEKCSGRLEIPWMVSRVTTSPHQGGVQKISVCAHGFAWPLHQDDTAQIEKSWRTIFSGLSLHMKTMWIRVRPCGSRKVRVAPADSSHKEIYAHDAEMVSAVWGRRWCSFNH